MLLAFPWLFVSFGLYNAIAFLKGNAAVPDEIFNRTLASYAMVSGAVWNISIGDALIALTLAFSFAETLKARRAPSVPLIDRALSAVLCALCLVEFVVRREAATSVFFLIMVMIFFDFIGSFFLPAKSSEAGAAAGMQGKRL
jgi:hypothetical protein